jgi:hypothetical protein
MTQSGHSQARCIEQHNAGTQHHRLTERIERRFTPAAAGIPKTIQLPTDFMRRIALAGGPARMARVTPEQRTRSSNRAAPTIYLVDQKESGAFSSV